MGSRPGNRETRLNSWMERTGQESKGPFPDKIYSKADNNQSSNLFNAQDLSRGELIYQDEKSKTYLFVEASNNHDEANNHEEEVNETGEDTGKIWTSDFNDAETGAEAEGSFPRGSQPSHSIGGLNAGLLEKGDFSKVNYWNEAATGQSNPRLEALLEEMNNHLEGIEKVLEQMDSHLQVHLAPTPTPVKSKPLLKKIVQWLKSLLKG